MKIVLASSNVGKIKEFQDLFSDMPYEFIPQKEFNVTDVEETGLTFVENAIIKARHACKVSGLPAIADDSGIEVDALNGAPGVFSARYAGADANDNARNEKLLDELKDVPEEKRTARYHSVIVLLRHEKDPSPLICHGVWEGSILFESKGSGGFGYDPIFYVLTHQCASAELTLEEKNKISHRAQAMQSLKESIHMAHLQDVA